LMERRGCFHSSPLIHALAETAPMRHTYTKG
jgi:hypothetical protein